MLFRYFTSLKGKQPQKLQVRKGLVKKRRTLQSTHYQLNEELWNCRRGSLGAADILRLQQLGQLQRVVALELPAGEVPARGHQWLDRPQSPAAPLSSSQLRTQHAPPASQRSLPTTGLGEQKGPMA